MNLVTILIQVFTKYFLMLVKNELEVPGKSITTGLITTVLGEVEAKSIIRLIH